MTGGARKSTVLIVDDSPINIKDLSHALMDDFEVSVAISGEEALLIIDELLPDIILLDIMMPGMDGFAVCKQIKENPVTRDIPVIFITADNDTINETRGLSIGAVDFIAKPINKPVLIARINTHMALKKAEKLALQAVKSKSQFLAMMSHEIRTPLNGIIGFANLLAKQPLNEQGHQFLDIIRKSSKHLLVIVNDILDYSKIESDKIILESIPLDIRKIVLGVSDLLALSARDKGIGFFWHCADEVPASVCGDPNRLRQVLFNLTSNAIKFTLQGQVELKVVVEKSRGDAIALHFWVRDTGIGIAPDAMEYLFQPFSQADTSTTRNFGGTGLGLVICARLVNLMGGEIQVESELERGSCFHFTAWFTLSAHAAEESSKISDPAITGRHFNGNYHLLVVEDVEVNRLYISELFSAFGIHAFDMANNGQEALERLHERSYDLVLMDCRMPIMDGFEATRRLRRREESTGGRTHTPVIALTANATEADRLDCLAAGMDGFLTKPIEEAELAEALSRWLSSVPALNVPPPALGVALEQYPESLPTPCPESPLDDRALTEKERRMGGERFVRLMRAFFQDVARNKDALRAAVTLQDAGNLFEAAHALKGCCGAVRAMRMIQLCGEMQTMGKIGAIQDSSELMVQIETEYMLVMTVLEAKLTQIETMRER
jgi:signal transduction histidine kinase/HPt (histidine-containing phosphotransfer) domain-containing protein